MCGDSHGIPATAAPSPDSGRGGKWSAAEVTLVSRVTCHVCHVSRVQHNSPEHRQRLHEAALIGPQVVQLGGLVGVHHVTVQHGGDLGRMT